MELVMYKIKIQMPFTLQNFIICFWDNKENVILSLTADYYYFFFHANSDYTSHFAAYDLGLHCLPMPLFGMLGIKWSIPLVTH